MIETKFKCPGCGKVHKIETELHQGHFSNSYYFRLEEILLCDCGLRLIIDTESNSSHGRINLECYTKEQYWCPTFDED